VALNDERQWTDKTENGLMFKAVRQRLSGKLRKENKEPHEHRNSPDLSYKTLL
jgi:hypothetical protein